MRIALFAICMHATTLCATSTTLPATELAANNYLLEFMLEQTYGKNNPFLELTDIVDLTLDAYQTSSTRSTNHHEEALTAFITTMQQASADALTSFASQTDHTQSMRTLADTCNKARSYIAQHLSADIRSFPAIKRKQKRFMGTIMGIGLFGGAFKYVIIALLGLAATGVLWKVSRIMTKETKKALHTTKEAEAEAYLALKDYAREANTILTERKQAQLPGSKTHTSAKLQPGFTGWRRRLGHKVTKMFRKKDAFTKKRDQLLADNPISGLSSNQAQARRIIVELCIILGIDPAPALKSYPRTSKKK